VLIKHIYTGSINAMIFVVSQGCLAGVDIMQEIWWPDTARNTVAQQKCPGGANSVGQLYTYVHTCITTKGICSHLQ